jgi:hypothetical protein
VYGCVLVCALNEILCMQYVKFRWWHALTLAHVMCMFHLYLHACSTHVSCNTHGFGTFSMHATCMLHDTHVTCVQQFRIKNCFPKCSIVIDVHACTRIHRWSGVSIRSDAERFRTNTYMIYLAYTLFLACIKHDMLVTWNMHVTCLFGACYSCYMRCAFYRYFDMHTTCILPLL